MRVLCPAARPGEMITGHAKEGGHALAPAAFPRTPAPPLHTHNNKSIFSIFSRRGGRAGRERETAPVTLERRVRGIGTTQGVRFPRSGPVAALLGRER